MEPAERCVSWLLAADSLRECHEHGFSAFKAGQVRMGQGQAARMQLASVFLMG